MWAWWPEILSAYARHHDTGEPLPQAEVDGLLAASSYGEGFARWSTSARPCWTTSGTGWRPEPTPWRSGTSRRSSTPPFAGTASTSTLVPPRYRSTYFQHAFLGGYDAGYYSYIWSEVLDADLVEWFHEHGGLQRSNGERFRQRLLSRGGSRDAMEMFAAVRGRGPRIEPLLERRGLTPGYTSQDAGGATVDGDGGAGQV